MNKDEIEIITRRGNKYAIVDIEKLEDLLSASNPEYLPKIKQARSSKEYFIHEDAFVDL